MIDFFSNVIGFLRMIFDLIVNGVTLVVTLINVLIGAVEVPLQLAVSVPGILGAGILITLAIFAAKFLIGR